jgi:HEAT repeat protein
MVDVSDCINTIKGKPSGLFSFRILPADKIACIAELAAIKEAYFEWVILPALRDADVQVQAAAAAVFRDRLVEMNEAKAVEERLSHLPVLTSDLEFWQDTRTSDELVALVSISSINRGGYIRQAAMQQMARTPHPGYVPFLLRRLGDWVPQVRDLAHRTLPLYLAPPFRAAFLKAIPEIDALQRVKRVDLRPAYGAIMHWLASTVEPQQLLNEVQGLGDASRFRIIRYLLAAQRCEQPLMVAFLRDRSFIVRLEAMRHLATRTEAWTEALLQVAMQDPAPSVRIQAFKELVRRGLATEAMLLQGSTDPSAEVRELATKGLRWTREALMDHYRACLRAGEQLVGAVLGLADGKDAATAADILPYTDHPDNAVRRAALMALSRVAPEEAYRRAMAMVTDRNKRIRAKAQAILLAVHDPAVLARAVELLAAPDVLHRSAGISLLGHYGGWQVLAPLLTACRDADPTVAEQAWTRVMAWSLYARNLFTRPSTADVEEARTALAQLKSHLHDPSREQRAALEAVEGFLS